MRAGVLPNTDRGHSAYMYYRDVTWAVKPDDEASTHRPQSSSAQESVTVYRHPYPPE